jgi:Pentapeptide repeats (8 copies)
MAVKPRGVKRWGSSLATRPPTIRCRLLSFEVDSVLPRLRTSVGIVLALTALLGCVTVFPRLLVRIDVGRARLERMASADYARSINEVRTTLLQALGGAVVLVGAYIAWQQLQTARQGQITERFTRAVQQLGDEKLAIRMGGIYALDRIGAESQRDRKAIVDLLAAYVRTHSPWPPLPEGPFPADRPLAKLPPLRSRAADVQAAVTVLGRWGPAPAQGGLWPTADLADADLRLGKLMGAHLWRVRLRGANLAGANLHKADLRGVDLEGAVLDEADLRDAVADATTWWPSGFEPVAAGVVVEGRAAGEATP